MAEAKSSFLYQAFNRRFLGKFRVWISLYVLVLPTLLSIAVFSYYPKLDVVVKSLYRWQPPAVVEFIGFRNFQDAFADPLFWQSFQLVFVLLSANLLKMWPAIFAAVALHRMLHERLRYIFQVCFVIPMVIPSMVWLLIWKSFYDPDFGILNRFLNYTGGMKFFMWLDGTYEAPGVMPRLATALNPFLTEVLNPVVLGIAGVIFWGALLLLRAMRAHHPKAPNRTFLILSALGLLLAVAPTLAQSALGWGGIVLGIFLLYQLARSIGPRWVLWMFASFAALILFRGSPVVFLLWWMGILAATEFVFRKGDYFQVQNIMRSVGGIALFAGIALLFLGGIWTEPTGQFMQGTPAWLGSKDLVVPAIIFWGFPWVGTTGTLIYLAGLQQIPQDVYEAAELDGIGPTGMLFRIELPLILTQVRINLIFMTISTLVTYEMFLILLGPEGGPGNKGMVPGLYMFSSAFQQGRFGYACALGMIMFVIILGLTIIYNKYVKVDK